MLDVMFYEVFDREEESLRRYIPKSIKADFTWKTVQEHGESAPPAKVISIRTQSLVPNNWAEKLSGILTRSAGYDHIIAYLNENKLSLPCGYLIDYCSRTVAEQAILLMMALMRRLKVQMKQFEEFQRDNMTGAECFGKNLLVVGAGHIGGHILRLGRALEMNVKAVDIAENIKAVEYVTLEKGIVWADIVVCSAALTHRTRGMLGYQSLSKAKKGCILVNIARGEISPVDELRKLLDEEKLAAVALDVFEREGLLAQKLREFVSDEQTRGILDLSRRENVVFTPHNAFNTREALERKAKESVESLQSFFQSGSFLHPVPTE